MDKLFPNPILKNFTQFFKTFYTACLYCMPSWGISKYIEFQLKIPYFYIIQSFSKKSGLELVSLPHFLHNFWRKIFILLYSINWPNFTAWLILLREILCNICITIVCYPGCDVMNIEINGATKSHFMYYSYVVIIFFNACLCRSAISTISVGKLVFCFSVRSAVFFVLNQLLWIKTLKYVFWSYVILLFNFALTL